MRFLREITGDRTFVYDWQPIAPLVETVIYAPPNDYILEKANAKTLTDILRQKRLRQLGTTIRRDPNSFTSQATLVVGIPAHRGPSAMSWLQRVAMDMEKLRISPHMAKDPIAWRKLIKAKRRGDLNNRSLGQTTPRVRVPIWGGRVASPRPPHRPPTGLPSASHRPPTGLPPASHRPPHRPPTGLPTHSHRTPHRTPLPFVKKYNSVLL